MHSDAHSKPRLMTIDQTATALALSRRTIYELISTGELRSIHIGAAHRVIAADVDAFIERLLVESA